MPLISWNGTIRMPKIWPYSVRISLLEQGLLKAKLIEKASPVYDTKATLHLLVSESDPIKGKKVIDQIQAKKGEGVIVRTLSAPYQIGDTKDIRKYKYLDDLDAIVIGIQKGVSTGSVILGLIRPSDKKVIEICRVRSGLLDKDLEKLSAMLDRGEIPVLKVQYLPIRTVGIKLVEPKTSIKDLRTDKLASDCTTDQLGEAKKIMFELAKPYSLAPLKGLTI